MIPLNSILATTDIVGKLPQIAALVCAILLLLAFFIGFAKGFRQIGWGWLTCLVAFVGFVALDGFLRKKNLVFKLFRIKGMSETAMTTLIVAFGCLAIALTLYGLFSAIFRPRKVWVKKDKYAYKEEQLSGEGDGKPKRLVWKNVAPPTFFGRFWGGVICVVNTAVILALVLSALLFLINATELSTTVLGNVLNIKITDLALQYATRYTLDFVTLCIPFFVACYGYKRGLVSSLRSIIVSAGTVLIIVLAFYLPFSPFVGKGDMDFLGKLVNRCTAIVGSGVPETIKPILGKVIAGVFLLIFFALLLVLVNYLLEKSHKIVRNAKAVRVIDSIVSCFLYFLIGVVLIVLLWAGLYTLELCGIFKVTEIIGENAVMARELLGFVKTFMDELLKPFMVAA